MPITDISVFLSGSTSRIVPRNEHCVLRCGTIGSCCVSPRKDHKTHVFALKPVGKGCVLGSSDRGGSQISESGGGKY